MRHRTTTRPKQRWYARALAALILIGLALVPARSRAYEIESHSTLTELAIYHAQARAGNMLAGLGFDAGFGQPFGVPGFERTAIEWMKRGSIAEDDHPRYCNHFHDPLKPLAQAGLSDFFGLGAYCALWPHDSSIAWAQRGIGAQAPFDRRSWHDARDYYFQALTGATSLAQGTSFARTFLSLGQIMHLVEDASVPAHVRNHAHPPPSGDGYHDWVKQHVTLLAMAQLGVIDPAPGLLRRRGPDPSAPLPIANLIDTDIYTGSNPEATVPASSGLPDTVGLAEFANANFLNPKAIFSVVPIPIISTDYPHPDLRSLTEMPPFTDPTNGRQYRSLKRNGSVLVAHAARESILNLLGSPVSLFSADDPLVYQDYAALLLPRAVGYSAALLPYFFRGAMRADAAGTDSITITNALDPASFEMMSGRFGLYYDAQDGKRYPVPGAAWDLALAPGATSPPLSFSQPTSPAPSSPHRYMLVFRGTLGLEPDAVAGQLVTLTTHTLRVTKSGGGTGSVASTPPGITCGGDCAEDYLHNATVTLAATPGAGYALSQWTGDCSGAAQSVTVGMTADKHCEAIFEKAYNLKITKVGSGTVTSAPAGIRCGADCSEDYVKGTSVRLEASPDAGFVFTGWSGACSGSSTTTSVTLSSNKQCTATFKPAYTLTVTIDGSGSGTISSSPDGIGCSTACSASFIAGTSVSLFASAKSGSVFGGWGGDCSSSEYFANVTMTGNKSCRATFNAGIPVFITRTTCSMSRDTATTGHIFVAVWGFTEAPAGARVWAAAYADPLWSDGSIDPPEPYIINPTTVTPGYMEWSGSRGDITYTVTQPGDSIALNVYAGVTGANGFGLGYSAPKTVFC